MNAGPQTQVDEIAPDIFRMSTWVPDITEHGFTFNQFLLTGDEPLLFHTGQRWISFGHLEADECAAMNLFLDAAPEPRSSTARWPALTESDCVAPALEAEEVFHATGLTSNLGATLEQLAELNPTTVAIMHGSSFTGDGAAQLRGLAAGYAAMSR